MKKILFLFSLVALSIVSVAQPRFGVRAGGDNTGSKVTFARDDAKIYTATIAITPSATSYNFVRIDSIGATGTSGNATVTIATAQAKDLDQITLIFDSVLVDASRVVTFSTGTKTSGTLTIAKSKCATITFIYDAILTKWLEVARATGL